MNKLIVGVLLLYNISLKAQDTMQLSVVMRQLTTHPQQDTVRINLLNQLAWHTDITTQLRDSLLQQTLALSQKLNYAKGASNALCIQSLYVEKSQAAGVAKQAIKMAKQSNDPATLFWAYRILGQAMINTSEGANALGVFNHTLALAYNTGNPLLIMHGQLNFVDYYKTVQTNYPLALRWSLQALQTAEQSSSPYQMGLAYRNLGGVYLLIGNQQKALENLQKALAASRQAGNRMIEQYTLNDIGERYRIMNKFPEALDAYSQAAKLISDSFNIELNQSNMAEVYERMGNYPFAFKYGFSSLSGARNLKDTIGISWIYSTISRAYLRMGNTDSAIWYARRGYEYAIQTNVLEYIRNNSEVLAGAYTKKNDYKNALQYYTIFITSRDSILNNEVTNKSNLTQFDYDLSKKQTEIEVLNKNKQLQQQKAKWQQLLLAGVLIALAFISVILVLLFRNNGQRKKAYNQLNEQNEEIKAQRDEKEKTLQELKATQAQLIQAEKMASLGELTAGIAHEIQNPLNFVNNFSDVNNELIDEMEIEMVNGDMEEAKAIAKDIRDNNQKIAHHGKRADSIVKGMLQHSRSRTGKKEPTNINALADEYLRLSYHGLRAKDKTFNAAYKTTFDESIGTIDAIPQDVGRVLLNLFNNAFYAVNEKKKTLGDAFEPLVTVSTKRAGATVEIVVQDNGTGIPQKIIDKIYQPFFTTKPAGEGTGLGLSLSYDIITKAHGGKLKVESEDGKGATFSIILPSS